MLFNAKEAADNLMKIADALEKEAFDSSFFVCDKCNHTANLSTINSKRAKAASENNVKNTNIVTVNDRVACPACEGVMAYAPTEKSARYWMESADVPLPELNVPEESEDDMDESKKNEKKPEDIAPTIDVSAPEDKPAENVFQPVDERENKDEEINFDLEEKTDEPKEETEGLPDEKGNDSIESTPPPVVEEEVPMDGAPEEEPKKKSKKKKDEVEFPKEDVPKFEKMPKDAADQAYQAALQKYSF